MEGRFIFGVCREPFTPNREPPTNAWFVRVHALRFVGGQDCTLRDFPDEEGDVFWPLGPEPPAWVKPGAICTLEVTRSPAYGQPGRSWYQPARGSVAPVATELIDISEQVSSEDALLHARHFYVKWPVPDRIYVRLQDHVYGPFHVEQRKRRVALVESHQEYVYFRYRWSDVLSTLAFRVRTPDGQIRWVLEDEDGFASLDRLPRDGRTTTQLMNWYLRGLRESNGVPEEIRNQITRKSLRSAATSYDIFSGDRELVEHRVERLHGLGRSFLTMAERDPTIMEVAMGETAFNDAVKRGIEHAVAEQKHRIEQQLHPLQVEVGRLETTRDELRQELTVLRHRLREETEQFEQHVETHTRQLMDQQQHLLQHRERLLRDLWVWSGLLKPEAASTAALPALSAVEIASSAEIGNSTKKHVPVAAGTETIDEPHQLGSQLLDAFGGSVDHLRALRALHTVLQQHRLFALHDIRDLEGLSRYAAALGPGTRIHHVPVEAGWTNTQSLFGRVNPNSRQFEPAPSGALEFWIEALELSDSKKAGMQFLVLHDANRSPMEVWLARLLLAASAPESPTIPLFHPRQVTTDDNLSIYAALSWPNNLWVVCVLATDPYIYEPSESLKQRLPTVTVLHDGHLPPLRSTDGYKLAPAKKVLEWDWETILEALG